MAKTKPPLQKLLESALPHPPEIEPARVYSRLHDDHDGTLTGRLNVIIAQDGDAHVFSDAGTGALPWLRYRTALGGGTSLRTRNALVILAYAMMLDEQDEQAKRRKLESRRTLKATNAPTS